VRRDVLVLFLKERVNSHRTNGASVRAGTIGGAGAGAKSVEISAAGLDAGFFGADEEGVDRCVAKLLRWGEAGSHFGGLRSSWLGGLLRGSRSFLGWRAWRSRASGLVGFLLGGAVGLGLWLGRAGAGAGGPDENLEDLLLNLVVLLETFKQREGALTKLPVAQIHHREIENLVDLRGKERTDSFACRGDKGISLAKQESMEPANRSKLHLGRALIEQGKRGHVVEVNCFVIAKSFDGLSVGGDPALLIGHLKVGVKGLGFDREIGTQRLQTGSCVESRGREGLEPDGNQKRRVMHALKNEALEKFKAVLGSASFNFEALLPQSLARHFKLVAQQLDLESRELGLLEL
jgi:hypothetical protein